MDEPAIAQRCQDGRTVVVVRHVRVGNSTVPPLSNVHDLEVHVDADVTMSDHVTYSRQGLLHDSAADTQGVALFHA